MAKIRCNYVEVKRSKVKLTAYSKEHSENVEGSGSRSQRAMAKAYRSTVHRRGSSSFICFA